MSDQALRARIGSYLGNGGFFNPEMMDHDKVRDLLMACRDRLALLDQAPRETIEHRVDRLVGEISERFRTFGGGRGSDLNPITHALRDKPLLFAAGVDVRAVVEFVLKRSAEHP